MTRLAFQGSLGKMSEIVVWFLEGVGGSVLELVFDFVHIELVDRIMGHVVVLQILKVRSSERRSFF